MGDALRDAYWSEPVRGDGRTTRWRTVRVGGAGPRRLFRTAAGGSRLAFGLHVGGDGLQLVAQIRQQRAERQIAAAAPEPPGEAGTDG